jgi:DNA polymerase-3 subunit delta'
MSVFDVLVGQQSVVAELRSAAEHAAGDTVGMTHAWLFTGPPGSGRTTAARAFAAALQCPDAGCGRCHACRTVLAGSHPDVRLVATESRQLSIAQIREAVQWASRVPAGGRWNVLLIEDADRLTGNSEAAANALLKMLEEPPPRTVWLLAAPSTEDLLPTLRSRCRSVRLSSPPAAAVAELLVSRDGVDPAMAGFVSRATQGHVGRARRLAIDEGARLRRAEVLRLPLHLDRLGDCLDVAVNLVEAAAEEADKAVAPVEEQERADTLASLGVMPGTSRMPRGSKTQLDGLEKRQTARRKRLRRDSIDLALLDVLAFYRDVLAAQLGAGADPIHGDLHRDAADVARRSSPEQTLHRIEEIQRARTLLRDTEANEQLVLEAMTVGLARAR